ncbi:MAG TPA: glycerate kinase [Desulfobacteraceae bacterium]|nr:glycerate kinase [Desulfobacteraceae bacterium]HPQ27173.1 glycerate kinase [Desulfobacteraceae bacterium]
MGDSLLKQMRLEAAEIFMSSINSVDPYRAVKRFVHIEGNSLIIGVDSRILFKLDLGNFNSISIVGGGKATAPMARAMEELLGERISEGFINVKYGFAEDLSYTKVTQAAHPLPDIEGVKGTRKILELLEMAGESDLIISLISGGGSALLPYPAGKITLSEKQHITGSLLACGASIDEINTVRKHISSAKGGQMARAAFPATTVNLMLSDVVGDKMDVIASGPFVPDSSTFEDALKIIKKYELKDVPYSIQEYLKAGLEGKVNETPKSNEQIFEKVQNFIVGSNILALEAARERAEKLGYKTLILSSMIEGETREVALVHTGIAKEILKTGLPVSCPACIISGGETTVTIKGNGLGGRNQEFCLAAAIELEGLPPRVVMLSGGTDGNDGPTDAAGAIVEPGTVGRGRDAGMEANDFLNNNDSYHFFENTQDLLFTGPTKTNVMDIRLVLVK